MITPFPHVRKAGPRHLLSQSKAAAERSCVPTASTARVSAEGVRPSRLPKTPHLDALGGVGFSRAPGEWPPPEGHSLAPGPQAVLPEPPQQVSDKHFTHFSPSHSSHRGLNSAQKNRRPGHQLSQLTHPCAPAFGNIIIQYLPPILKITY